MPQIEQINPTTYKIASGRDAIEIGNIDDAQCLAHMKVKRWHGNSEFVLSYPGLPTGLAINESTLTIKYGGVDVELTAHAPDGDNPDGRGEFNVILKSKPTPDVNGDYWQVLDFDSKGLNFKRVLGLDEEWSQERCHEIWYDGLYDDHIGNVVYGHDNGTGIFVRTSTEIRTPDGEVVLKSKPEHLVHSLLGTAIKNTHKKHELGEIKASTPNKGKQLIYATVSRDHARLPRRELIDAKGKKARIEDIQLVGSQLWFKLPKDFIEKAKYPVQHVTGLDPAYTEDMDFWVTDYGNDNTWEDYDLFTNKGVPKGAVAEIIIANQEAGNEADLGIRTDGSALDLRRIVLHEAETGGVTTCRMFVVCHANTGLVETYADDVSDENIFYLVGYWENVSFTEFSGFAGYTPANPAVWQERVIFPAIANLVTHFILKNSENNTANTMGVRATGSALDRKVLVHEPEGGGTSILDMLVLADADHTVELYTSDRANAKFHVFGNFGAELDFTELFQVITNDGDGDWDALDLSAWLDQDGRVCDFLLTHNVINAEQTLGVRDGDDAATNRYILEHEAEDNGGATGEVTGFGISAKSNAAGVVNLYSSTASEVFYLMGYFVFGVGGFFQNVGQGAIAISGNLGLKTFIDVGDADVAIAGALVSVKRFILAVGSGAVGIAGTLGRNIFIAVGAAAMAIAGVLGRNINITVGDGATGIAGALGRYIKITVGDADMAIAGALITVFRFSLVVGSGAIAIAGTLGRNIAIAVGQGGTTPSGVLGFFTKISIGAGSVGIAGALTTIFKQFIAVGSGSIAIAGALNLLTKKAVGAGSIAIAGALSTILTVFVAVGSGAVGIAGILNNAIKLSVGAGSIAIAGVLGRAIKLAVGAGAVGMAGTLGRNIFKAVGGGAVGIAGILGRLTRKAVGAGAMAITGVLGTVLAGVLFFQAVGGGAVAISGTLFAVYRYIEFTVKLFVRDALTQLLSRTVIGKLLLRSTDMVIKPKPLSMTTKLQNRSVILKMRLV